MTKIFIYIYTDIFNPRWCFIHPSGSEIYQPSLACLGETGLTFPPESEPQLCLETSRKRPDRRYWSV